MVERNAETESKAVDVLIDEWDRTIAHIAAYIARREYLDSSTHDIVNFYLNHLDIIERVLTRLAAPSLRPPL